MADGQDPLATAAQPTAPTAITTTSPQQVTADILAGQQAAQAAPPAAGPVQAAPVSTDTAMIPQQAPAQLPEVAYHTSMLHRILDRVGSILGGDETMHVTKDADGNVSVTKSPSTTGEKWGRVAAAALSGAAQGLANSQGPGGMARAAAAGIQTGMQMPEQRQQQVQQEATAEQQRMLANANNAALHIRNMQGTIGLREAGINLAQDEANIANKVGEETRNSASTTLVASGKDMNDIVAHHQKNPDIVKYLNGDPTYKSFVTFDGSGQPSVGLYKIDPGPAGQLNTKPYTLPIIAYGQDGRPSLTFKTIDPGTQKLGLLDDAARSTATTYFDQLAKYSTAEKNLREPTTTGTEFDRFYTNWRRDNNLPDTAANELKARKQFAVAGSVRTGAGGETGGGAGTGGGNPQLPLQSNAQMMVDGLAAPSQLSKRAKDYNQMLPMANAYSLQKYGEPFDAEISEARYKARQEVLKEFAGGKQADQIQSGQTFLNHAQAALDGFADLRNKDLSLFNTPINKLRQMSGNPRVSAILPDIAAVRREYENFLSNNMALKGAEIKEGSEMLNENMSPAQFEAAMKSFAQTAVGRMGSLNERALRFQVPIGGELLTPRNMKTLANMGLSDYTNELIRRQPQAPAMFGQRGQPQQQQQQQSTFQRAPTQPTNPPFAGAVYGTGPQGLGWYPPSQAGGQ